MLYLFSNLTEEDLARLSHLDLELSRDGRRAVTRSPAAASLLPSRHVATTTSLTRSEAILEWLS